MPLSEADQYGAYVPTTLVWDLGQIEQIDINSPEFKELLVRLYQNINNIAMVLNIKDTGKYVVSEFVNGQTFFSNPALSSGTDQVAEDRQVLRKVIYYDQALPNTGTIAIAHGITCTAVTTFTRIYGVANDTTGKNYIPLPYASPTLANNVELKVDATNVTISTGSNRSNLTKTYIILEYLQS